MEIPNENLDIRESDITALNSNVFRQVHGTEVDRDSVVSDVLLAYLERHRVEPIREIRAWLATAAKLIVRSHLRRLAQDHSWPLKSVKPADLAKSANERRQEAGFEKTRHSRRRFPKLLGEMDIQVADQRSYRDIGAPCGVRRAVRDTLNELPADHREIVELRYFLNLTVADAAHQLGIPVGTAKSRLRLALARLKQNPRLRKLVEFDCEH